MKRKEGRKGGYEEGSIRAPLIVWNGIINSWFRKGFHVSPLYTGEREILSNLQSLNHSYFISFLFPSLVPLGPRTGEYILLI